LGNAGHSAVGRTKGKNVLSAIFGLVGVVVGGLLTGAVSLWQQRRAHRAEARAASRLLSAELSEQHVFLEALVRRDPEAPGRKHLPAVAAWLEQCVPT